jgi:hypothetical protein
VGLVSSSCMEGVVRARRARGVVLVGVCWGGREAQLRPLAAGRFAGSPPFPWGPAPCMLVSLTCTVTPGCCCQCALPVADCVRCGLLRCAGFGSCSWRSAPTPIATSWSCCGVPSTVDCNVACLDRCTGPWVAVAAKTQPAPANPAPPRPGSRTAQQEQQVHRPPSRSPAPFSAHGRPPHAFGTRSGLRQRGPSKQLATCAATQACATGWPRVS